MSVVSVCRLASTRVRQSMLRWLADVRLLRTATHWATHFYSFTIHIHVWIYSWYVLERTIPLAGKDNLTPFEDSISLEILSADVQSQKYKKDTFFTEQSLDRLSVVVKQKRCYIHMKKKFNRELENTLIKEEQLESKSVAKAWSTVRASLARRVNSSSIASIARRAGQVWIAKQVSK